VPHHHRPTTIAILGADTLIDNALALLLEGVGYSARILYEPPRAGAGDQLEGVDLLLLMPSLSEGEKEGFLEAIGSASAVGDMPVLALSTARKEELEDRKGVVPWPTPLENLGQAIEAALVPAPNGAGPLPPEPTGRDGVIGELP